MKIDKKTIVRNVKDELSNIGYTYIEDTVTVAQGLFYKRLTSGFIITIGFVIHRFNPEFAFSFYLSKGFNFGLMGGDYPRNAYLRFGQLLHAEEKNELFPYVENDQVVDFWWDTLDDSTISVIGRIVKLCEKRFLDQPGLLQSLQESKTISEYFSISDEVIQFVVSQAFVVESKAYIFAHLPRNKDHVPEAWFKATEIVVKNRIPDRLNKNYIQMMAVDSWRRKNLE